MADYPTSSLPVGLILNHSALINAKGGSNNAAGLILNHSAILGGIAPDVDSSAPAVVVVSPAPGTPIYRMTEVVVNVTDNSGTFRVIEFQVQLGGDVAGDRFVIHDGLVFLPAFRTSYRIPIANGFQYTLRRIGGWPSPPKFYARAIDQSGNENA